MNTQFPIEKQAPDEATTSAPVTLPSPASEAKRKTAETSPQKPTRTRSSAPRKTTAAATKPSAAARSTSATNAKAGTVPPRIKAITEPQSKPVATPTKKIVAVPKSVASSNGAQHNKSAKAKKAKMVRDSFTMPQPEYDLIANIKKRCVANGLAVKKSEVLRAAVIQFAAMGDAQITAALDALETIKTGRPPKGKK